MTASASLDGGPLGATERAFPALDGVRALAATAVLLLHVGSMTGDNTSGVTGRVISHMDAGVAVFFVLSGFLLFRPFADAALRGAPAPGTGPYLWRRALRILPAYWLTVAAALILLQGNADADGSTWFRHLALIQIYDGLWFSEGLDHVWSLCVEVSFYAVLPFVAAGLLRPSRGRGRRPLPTLLGIGSLTVIGPVYLFLSWLWREGPVPTNLWLPAFAGWFGGGMALAVITVADPQWGPVRLARAVGGNLGRCWTAALALFVLACTDVTGQLGFVEPTPTEALIKNVLYMGIAFFFVLPLVVAGPDQGPCRRALSSRPVRWLGEVSYGVFLVHVLVLRLLYEALDAEPLTGSLWLVAPMVWLASVAVATLLYVAVERPVRRWRSLVPDPARAAASHREGVPTPAAGAAGRRSGWDAPPTEPGSVLLEMARGGDAQALAGQLDAGASVDTRDSAGDSLLMVAAGQGHAETVALLLARGADHSGVNDRGQTALGLAVFRQSADTVRQLLSAGADPDAGGPSARATALYFGLPAMTALLEGAPR